MLIERKGSVKLLKTGEKKHVFLCFDFLPYPPLLFQYLPPLSPVQFLPNTCGSRQLILPILTPPPFQVLFSQAKKSVVSRPFSFGIVFRFKISWIINCPTLCPFVFDSLPTPLFCLLVFFFFSTFCLIWYLIYLLTLAIRSSSLFNKHENPISGRRTVWKPILNLRFSVFAFLSKILRC